jgi:hypothetical protein
MEESILNSTKKILGLEESYTAFDLDVITHINAAFSTLEQLGIGPIGGYMITDNVPTWAEFIGSDARYNAVKSYVFLRVRMLFDPPATSYHVEAMNRQIQELEWRLNLTREVDLEPLAPPGDFILDGGGP